MVKSMTGYGRAQMQLSGRDIMVEIKSVNHRFFEFSARTPRAYGYLEEKLKQLVGVYVSRGKVEIGVSIGVPDGSDSEVHIDRTLARGYMQALRCVAEELELNDDLSLSTLARFTDIFKVQKTREDEEEVWNCVCVVAKEAVQGFVAMREREGARLRTDMLLKLDAIETYVAKVEACAPQTVLEYRERLYRKLSELLADRTVDDARILQEVGIFADRIAADEEIVRLRSHLTQLRQILDTPEAVGRKLDFLVQEINREVNTIGSKAQDASIARMVIEMKSEVEKIREQIQNIE